MGWQQGRVRQGVWKDEWDRGNGWTVDFRFQERKESALCFFVCFVFLIFFPGVGIELLARLIWVSILPLSHTPGKSVTSIILKTQQCRVAPKRSSLLWACLPRCNIREKEAASQSKNSWLLKLQMGRHVRTKATILGGQHGVSNGAFQEQSHEEEDATAYHDGRPGQKDTGCVLAWVSWAQSRFRTSQQTPRNPGTGCVGALCKNWGLWGLNKQVIYEQQYLWASCIFISED